MGFTTKVSSGKDKSGRDRLHTVCGLLMHSSLTVTTDGLPLGMAAVKFWTRKKFKGTNALLRKINPTRMPIEGKESMRWLDNLRRSTGLLGDPARCVHICAREGDIWELFCLARELDTHCLVRRCSDRLADDGSHTVASIMAEGKVRELHRVAVRDDKSNRGSTQVEISYRRMTIWPPIAKQERYPALILTVLHAREPEEPVGRPRIDWKLITDLPIDGHAAAIEKLQWYAMRWKIEVFHKVLKSGCRAEPAQLRTAVFCILSWRVFWLTMLNRVNSTTAQASPSGGAGGVYRDDQGSRDPPAVAMEGGRPLASGSAPQPHWRAPVDHRCRDYGADPRSGPYAVRRVDCRTAQSPGQEDRQG